MAGDIIFEGGIVALFEWECQVDTARNGPGRLTEHANRTRLLLLAGQRLPRQIFVYVDLTLPFCIDLSIT